MTLTERLWTAGIVDKFDDAVRNLDSARLRPMLMQVGFTEVEADEWLVGCLEGTYWIQMLPGKLREFGLKEKFEEAVTRQDEAEVVSLLREMGASSSCAKHEAPTFLHNYFQNYK